MGRFTIFTRTSCLESGCLKQFMLNHDIHYVEINLTLFPDRNQDLMGLLGTSAVVPVETPQLFCNNRHVASCTPQLKDLLQQWQNSFDSLLPSHALNVKYGICSDARLRVPLVSCASSNISMSCNCDSSRVLKSRVLVRNKHNDSSDRYYQPTMLCKSLDLSLMDLTRVLLKRLPQVTYVYKKRNHCRCFLWNDLLKTLQEWLNISNVNDFANALLLHGVVLVVVTRRSKVAIFRLHASENPDILNRTCPLQKTKATQMSPRQALLNLCHILEMACIASNADTKSHALDVFEEQVTALREIEFPADDFVSLLNLFNLMVYHASLQSGNRRQWQALLSRISYEFLHKKIVRLDDITALLTMNKKNRFFPSVKSVDPRYALLCSRGTKSSPKIRTYETDEDTILAIRSYVQDVVCISSNRNALEVPHIFGAVFTKSHDLLAWLVQYLDDGPILTFIAANANHLVIHYQPCDGICTIGIVDQEEENHDNDSSISLHAVVTSSTKVLRASLSPNTPNTYFTASHDAL